MKRCVLIVLLAGCATAQPPVDCQKLSQQIYNTQQALKSLPDEKGAELVNSLLAVDLAERSLLFDKHCMRGEP